MITWQRTCRHDWMKRKVRAQQADTAKKLTPNSGFAACEDCSRELATGAVAAHGLCGKGMSPK